MDRRYSQSRFYNGVPASAGSRNKADKLVSQYLARARKSAVDASHYGGSTGGRKSLDKSGLRYMKERSQLQKEKGAIFKEEGTGLYGARAELGRMRTSYGVKHGFRHPVTDELNEPNPDAIARETRTSPNTAAETSERTSFADSFSSGVGNRVFDYDEYQRTSPKDKTEGLT